jgi:hypothetical protein
MSLSNWLIFSSLLLITPIVVNAQDMNKNSIQNKQILQTASAPETKLQDNSSPMKVHRAVITLNVEENEPDVVDTIFPPEVKRLYCYSHITGASTPSEIQHRWYWNDDLQSSIPLKVNSASWRTYSAKSISPVCTGEWLVSIVDTKNEAVLKTIRFFIKPAKE